MKVRLSPAAEADLEAIADYIAADNPGRARSFVRELRARCAALGDAPKAHALRHDLGREVRCCPHGNYLVLYRATAGEVLVSRVVHASRDVRRLARAGQVNEPRPEYEVSDFEALGFLRVSGATGPGGRCHPERSEGSRCERGPSALRASG